MNTPETAPKTGEPFLGDFGYPWWVLTCWSFGSEEWVYPEMQISFFEGRPDPCYETEWAEEHKLLGWIPLPEKV